MVKKLRKKFIIYSISSIFAFLVLILTTINVVNFSLVASNADNLTSVIEENGGHYESINQDMLPPEEQTNTSNNDFRPGPGSPEMKDSLRYFTFQINNDGSTTEIEFKINAYDKLEAENWAKELSNTNPIVGWSRIYYRYRIFTDINNNRFVTVIDQSRELAPCYNVMYASLIGSSIALVIVTVIMILISKKLVQPLIDNDNKQRRFIAHAANTLRTPLSVIAIDNATLVNSNGNKDSNISIDKQIKKLTDLADDLNSFAVMNDVNPILIEVNITNLIKEIAARFISGFNDSNKKLDLELEDNIFLTIDKGMFEKMLTEIFENLLKYSDSNAKVKLFKEDERLLIIFINDAKGIPEGSLDRVFDKFYRLDYKDHSQYDGHGVGLAIVKEIIDKHHGRISAKGEDDTFILKIEL